MNDKARTKKKPKHHAPASVTFFSYPKLLFAWPLIVIGPLFWFIAGSDPSAGKLEVMGWVYLITVLVVVLTISIDLERNHAVFWLIVIGAFFILGRWLVDVKHFTLFGDLYQFFALLDAQYSPGMGVAISCLLVPPYLVMMLWARLQNKWRITHNEFEQRSWGRSEDSLARGAKRVRSTYPDVLELLLGMAGTLIVYSATGRNELRRIHHVPMLPLLRLRIDRILESTSVTVDEMADEEAETERDEDSVSDESSEGETGAEKL